MKYRVAIHTAVFVDAKSPEEAQEIVLNQIENGLVDTCDVEEVVDDAGRFSGIWTVSIKDREDADMDIWTASFSTEGNADAFKNAAEEKLKAYGVFDTVDVTKDMSHLDDDMYLDWIDARYGEEGECY